MAAFKRRIDAQLASRYTDVKGFLSLQPTEFAAAQAELLAHASWSLAEEMQRLRPNGISRMFLNRNRDKLVSLTSQDSQRDGAVRMSQQEAQSELSLIRGRMRQRLVAAGLP